MSSNKLGFPIVLGLVWALLFALTLMSFARFTGTAPQPRTGAAAEKAAHSLPAGRAPQG